MIVVVTNPVTGRPHPFSKAYFIHAMAMEDLPEPARLPGKTMIVLTSTYFSAAEDIHEVLRILEVWGDYEQTEPAERD